MDDSSYPAWDDMFFQLEDRANISGEAIQIAYGRYVKGMKAIVDSYDIPVGLAPKEIVWSLNKTKLFRYIPVKPPEEIFPIPLLLVYALINKPFIFDLAPGKSFVEFLLNRGSMYTS